MAKSEKKEEKQQGKKRLKRDRSDWDNIVTRKYNPSDPLPLIHVQTPIELNGKKRQALL